MIFIFNKEVDNLYFILQYVILIMLYILIDVLKGMLGKNVLSLLYIVKMCSNFERCIFVRLFIECTFYF